MLLEYLSRYYKWIWLLFCAIAFLKILLSYSFHGRLNGFGGVIYSLFNWYGEEEMHMEDSYERRKVMKLHNVVTALLYLSMLLLIAIIVLRKVLNQ